MEETKKVSLIAPRILLVCDCIVFFYIYLIFFTDFSYSQMPLARAFGTLNFKFWSSVNSHYFILIVPLCLTLLNFIAAWFLKKNKQSRFSSTLFTFGFVGLFLMMGLFMMAAAVANWR